VRGATLNGCEQSGVASARAVVDAATTLPAPIEAGALDIEQGHRQVSRELEAFDVPLVLTLGNAAHGRLIREGVGPRRAPPPIPYGSVVVPTARTGAATVRFE
jgi:hypothetical protein